VAREPNIGTASRRWVSLPEPVSIESLPRPAKIRFAPSPASIVSLSWLPKTTSAPAPAPAMRQSLPNPPTTELAPPSALIVSAPPSSFANGAGGIGGGVTVYFTSALFVIAVLGTIAHLGGFSILRFIADIKDELLIVLGTSSSETVLPQMMQKMEHLTLAATLAIVPDIPIQSLALLVGIDKFMSECRALINLIGNGVATISTANGSSAGLPRQYLRTKGINSVPEWDRQFRLVRVHHEHREQLGRLRLAGIGADAVASVLDKET
jgi:sodium:dicarboxylate symporter family protein